MQARSGEMKWEGSKLTAKTGTFDWQLSVGGGELTVFSWGNSPVAYFGVSETWNAGLFSLGLFGKRIVLPAANSISNLIQQGALSLGRRDSDCRG